jgi:hyperosmotically inducible periplasmic protein
MRKIHRISAALLLLAFVSFAGTPLASAAWQANDQREAKSEQNLVREVRHQLLLLPYYTVFDNLAYRVEGDRVILEGQVVNPVVKSDAQAAVKSIEGVAGITNNIQVLPPSPMDEQLRRALYRAIYGEPQLSKYAWSAVASIHIIVDNGHVTLEGVVDNEADKNLAGLRANSVPNVFSVTNNLKVGGNSAGNSK